MKIGVTLYGPYRELVPKEAHGKTEVEAPLELRLKDIPTRLGIGEGAIYAVNGQMERDLERPLQDGDQVQILRPIGGG